MTYLNTEFLLTALVFYLIGSVPAGYILVKLFNKKDLTKEGSGNVGTLNAFIVTKSRVLAGIVLLVDFLKGLLPVFILFKVYNYSLEFTVAVSCFLIVGHNFPVWLKFKGGRGLATSAGIFLLINSFLLLIWVFTWLIIFMLKRSVLFSNFIATVFIPVYTFLFWVLHIKYPFYPSEYFHSSVFFIYSLFITLLIILKHIEVFNKFLPLKAAN